MIIINMKNYLTGMNVLDFTKRIENTGVAVAVSALYLREIIKNTKLNVFSQHVDYSENEKRATGYITAYQLKNAGAKGSLLNHSEHPLEYEEIKKIIQESKKNGLKIIVCAKTINEVKNFIPLKPYAIAFEDPELIGTGKSITQYNQIELKKFVQIMKNHEKILKICGAGISTNKDYAEALKIGCDGILISSAIVLSKNPEETINKLKNFGSI